VARYGMTAESQSAQPAGAPSGSTFNGYFAAVMAGASANYKLRRVKLGVRDGAAVPVSQQMTVAVYRQSVACAGTGFTLTAGTPLDPRAAASAIGGLLITTATAAGTTGPTLAANAIAKFSFNLQSSLDIPNELLEEMVCDQGTANGLAFVNLGNALPASHLFTIDTEWEE
jgi:hypothetical protein